METTSKHTTLETNCEHEIVTVEYMGQPYGHCLECGCTVIKDDLKPIPKK